MDQQQLNTSFRNPFHRLRLALAGMALAGLAACGGGGGGGGVSSGPATVSGTARYESVPVQSDGSGLNYAGTVARPIRGATVQLLDASGNLIGSTVTDSAGGYSFSLASGGNVQVRVRAELKRSAGANYDVTVRDNTASNAIYVLDSGVFAASGSVSRNLTAASGWGGANYSGTRAAAPFAILDVAYQGVQKVLTVAPSATLPALQVFWSRRNVPSDGDPAQGMIGTSFFTTGGAGSPALYLLGAEDIDTDEYDDHVVAHEFGHYLQYAVSRDDSIGGPHSDTDKLDMRVAFSEGFGNAWSAMQLGSAVYFDTRLTRQASGFSFSVADRPTGNLGWYSEASLQYLIYMVHQDPALGFQPIYEALSQLRTSPAFSSAFSMAAALKIARPAQASTITSLWQDQNITSNDAYGSGEMNAGAPTVAQAVPVYKLHMASQGTAQTYCVNGEAGVNNKLSNWMFVRFAVASGGSHTITLSYLSGATPPSLSNPNFVLLRSDGTVSAAEAFTANTESLPTTLSAGMHSLALTDYNLDLNETRCLNLVIN